MHCVRDWFNGAFFRSRTWYALVTLVCISPMLLMACVEDNDKTQNSKSPVNSTDTSDAGEDEVLERDTSDPNSCTNSGHCESDYYCNLSLKPPACEPRLTANDYGKPCNSQDDCAQFDAKFCDEMVANFCKVSNCDLKSDNCPVGFKCCDGSWIGWPNMCLDLEELVPFDGECYDPNA